MQESYCVLLQHPSSSTFNSLASHTVSSALKKKSLIYRMCHNQQHNSQKLNDLRKKWPVYTLLNIRNDPQLHAFCGQGVHVVPVVRDSYTSV